MYLFARRFLFLGTHAPAFSHVLRETLSDCVLLRAKLKILQRFKLCSADVFGMC